MTAVVILIICLIFALVFVVGIDVVFSKHSKPKLEDLDARERLVDISLDISEQIVHFLIKYNISEKEFCRKLNITNDTLSSWLSGLYDFKLSQLTRIESVFNEHLIKSTLIDRKKIKLI